MISCLMFLHSIKVYENEGCILFQSVVIKQNIKKMFFVLKNLKAKSKDNVLYTVEKARSSSFFI